MRAMVTIQNYLVPYHTRASACVCRLSQAEPVTSSHYLCRQALFSKGGCYLCVEAYKSLGSSVSHPSMTEHAGKWWLGQQSYAGEAWGKVGNLWQPWSGCMFSSPFSSPSPATESPHSLRSPPSSGDSRVWLNGPNSCETW